MCGRVAEKGERKDERKCKVRRYLVLKSRRDDSKVLMIASRKMGKRRMRQHRRWRLGLKIYRGQRGPCCYNVKATAIIGVGFFAIVVLVSWQ
eukprot:10964918-Karenia_brevis.AAC.1